MESLPFARSPRFDWQNFMRETSPKELGQSVRTRKEALGKYKGSLGPPDMICFKTESEDVFFKKKKENFFMYCYGVPMPSELVLHLFIYKNFCVGHDSALSKNNKTQTEPTPLNKRNKEQNKRQNQKKSLQAIKKIQFWVFNAICGHDVRYTIRFPGANNLKAFDFYGNEYSQSQINWTEVFVSSMLRLICAPHSIQHFLVYSEFLEHINEFTDAFIATLRSHPFLANCLFDSDKEQNDKNRFESVQNKPIYSLFTKKGQEVLQKIYNFYLNVGHAKSALLLFTYLSNIHLPAMVFTSKVLSSCRLYRENILLISRIVYRSPVATKFLRLQAAALGQFKSKLKEASSLAKWCISLEPNNIESWLVYAKILLDQKELELCLDALNVMGYTVNLQSHLMGSFESNLVHSESLYFVPLSTELSANFFKRSKIDFEFFGDEISWFIDELSEKTREFCKLLNELPGNELKNSKVLQKMYKILIQIEKKVGIEELFRIRDLLFLHAENKLPFGHVDSMETKRYKEAKCLLFGQVAPIKFHSKGQERGSALTDSSENQSRGTNEGLDKLGVEKQSQKKAITETLDFLFLALFKDHEAFESFNKSGKNLKVGEKKRKKEKIHPLIEIQMLGLCRRLRKWKDFEGFFVSIDQKGFSVYAYIKQCKVLGKLRNKEKLKVALMKLIKGVKEEIIANQGLSFWLQKLFAKVLRVIGLDDLFSCLDSQDTGINSLVSEFLNTYKTQNDTTVIQKCFEETSFNF